MDIRIQSLFVEDQLVVNRQPTYIPERCVCEENKFPFEGGLRIAYFEFQSSQQSIQSEP